MKIQIFNQNRIAVFALLLILIFCVFTRESLATLKAGFSKIDITPENPVVMFGYQGRGNTLSEGVHDRLYARVTAFENDGKKLLIISSDLGDFYFGTYEYFQEAIAEEFALDQSEIFLTCTHTHAAPTLTIDKEKNFTLFKIRRKDAAPYPTNLEYTKHLKSKLISAVKEAFDRMQDVRIGAGIGYCPIGMNRRAVQPDGSIALGRNPYGPVDKDVHVLKIIDNEDQIKSLLFDFATHGTSLGQKNLQISGDVLGLAAQFVENYHEKEVIAPVFPGASGDINPWYVKLTEFNDQNGWIPETELLGIMLGEEVVHTHQRIKEFQSECTIKTAFAAIELPTRGEMRGQKLLQKTYPLNITAARIGDVAFIGFGTEMLTEIGMEIKKASPFKYTFLITHCNGASGYLAPHHAYTEDGYEIFSSPFAPQAAEMVVTKALSMLYDLKN